MMSRIKKKASESKKSKNEKGFSLLEIIISVAALSLVGVFIVQMFISSSNLNKRARDVDNASAAAVAAAENFKNLASYDNGAEYVEYGYFNKEWEAIDSNGADVPDGAAFLIKTTITPDAPDEVESGRIYEADIAVTDMRTDGGKVIASLTAKKYFPNEN